MSRDILAVDVGTTALKLGVFSPEMKLRWETSRRYDVHVYDGGKADIHPDEWWRALVDACREAGERLNDAGVIAFSVTTPGLTPMAADGAALGPGILFFDGRSTEQARWIRGRVGEEKFLRETCNLPVTGGSSLCSILWIREHQPAVWDAAAKFGHTNTYMVKRLTGNWVIDPSTVSITGLYNTARNDLTWNDDVLRAAGIPAGKLPALAHSHECAGTILAAVAEELGLARDCAVLVGGNDAVLAAFSGGMTAPGEITNICGTCEITYVCVDQPISSPNFNIRCHVAPGRWVTFFVLNTGGKALEWFHGVFCAGMSEQSFYEEYIPEALDKFFADPDRREARLPEYAPYLAGSRYSLDALKAGFAGVTLETTRDDMLVALIRGNALYAGGHLKEVGARVPLARKVHTTGGGAKIRGMMEAKRRWTGDFDYEYQDQSSLAGAAMLGQIYLRSV
ncbi:MAG: FGGY family carbohydrate kinase [Bryobacterales bacterium]|nr:FGGY family carbohydrate kinase [Bryobacterales bacterium]